MLELNNVEVVYDDVILVLKGLSLRAERGRITALLGTNGAGKSTTLKAISGLLQPEDGAVTDGAVLFEGERIDRLDAAAIVRRGIFQVMEGRRVFEHLTCEENLLAGGYTRRDRSEVRSSLDIVYRYFPRLRERASQQAGYLSGGEQQMLAIGRALMAKPRVMLLDEPSLGLAPLVVKQVFEVIQRINKAGTTVLLAEQNAYAALKIADRGYVIEGGRIVMEGDRDSLLGNDAVRKAYIGA